MAIVPIPLGLQSYSRPSGFQPETILRNMYIESDQSGDESEEAPIFRLQRAGLDLYDTLSGPIRGIYQKTGVGDGLPFCAAGSSLVTTDGATNTVIGTITDDGDTVPMVASNFALGLCAGGDFFLYDYDTLSQISLPDDRAIIDLETINSYFLLPTASGRFYWLTPGSSEVNALDFATAESCPDGLIGIKRLNDEFYLFGTSTTETWQLTGEADSPFQKAQGRAFDKGAISRDTIVNFDNSIVWVGDDGIVYRVSNVPQRISDFGIEERLRNRSDAPSAWSFTQDAHKFYVLSIPSQGTFAYDSATRAWSEFSSLGSTLWKPTCGVPYQCGTLCGGNEGKLWKLNPDSSTDEGVPFERVVSGSISLAGRPLRKDSFSLLVGCSEDCDIRLRWRDGRDDFNDYVSMSARSPVDIVNLFRLGQSSQPITTFEISCVADAKIRYSQSALNGAWR